MRRSLLALLLATTTAGAASAADLYGARPVVPSVVPAYVYNWTGLYLGLHAGYGWGDADWGRFGSGTSHDVDGFIGGAQIGWLYQFPTSSFVIGAEAQWTWTDLQGSGGCSFSLARCSTEINWTADFRLKAGFAWDRALIYGVGGLALADLDHSERGVFSRTDTETGWTLGLGLAYAVTDQLSLGLEYKYTNFGEVSFRDAGVRFTDDLDFHSVTARLNYKLGW